MNRMLRIAVSVVFAVVVVTYAVAQEKKITQTAGVDNTRMGAYRALAHLSFRSFQKGDNATAAELARVLERTWDHGEWHNTSEGSFCKSDRSVCEPIDKAMDEFIKPILHYETKTPDPAEVKKAFDAFLEKLKLADASK